MKKIKLFACIAIVLTAFVAISSITNDASTGAMIAPFLGLAVLKRDPNQEGSTLSEKQALMNDINDLIKSANKGLISKSDFDSLLNKVNSIENSNKVSAEEFSTIKAAVANIEGIVKAMKEIGVDVETSTPLKAALKNNIEKLKVLKEGDKGELANAGFTIKAAASITHSNVSGGNVPVEQRIAGMNAVASRRVRLLDLFSRGVASSNIISWVYQANKDGAAGGTAEGAAKNQIDFDLVVASQTLCKRTAYIKVSTEMIDDVDFIESEINNELMRELLKDLELTAYSGNNTPPALNGVRTTATSFAAGDFANAIDNANQVDVLAVAINQILIANQPMPTSILMHPTDVTKLKVAKVSATDKRYIERLQMIGGELSMDGVPIIPTTLVTAGEYLVGDFSLATLYTKGDMAISVGLDADDFTKNLRTIMVEVRAALVTKNNDRTAFVKGVFATDMAALETA